jgi:hypothetical protein
VTTFQQCLREELLRRNYSPTIAATCTRSPPASSIIAAGGSSGSALTRSSGIKRTCSRKGSWPLGRWPPRRGSRFFFVQAQTARVEGGSPDPEPRASAQVVAPVRLHLKRPARMPERKTTHAHPFQPRVRSSNSPNLESSARRVSQSFRWRGRGSARATSAQ